MANGLMRISTKVAGRVAAVGLGTGVNDGVAVGDGAKVAVNEGVAATVGDKVAVGESTTGVDSVCTVGVGVAVLMVVVGVGTCGSWSPGRSNTDCATARSFDRRVAAALVSAA